MIIPHVCAWLRQWQRRDHNLKAAVLVEGLYRLDPSKRCDRTIGIPDVKICIHWVSTERSGEGSEITQIKKWFTVNELIRIIVYLRFKLKEK